MNHRNRIAVLALGLLSLAAVALLGCSDTTPTEPLGTTTPIDDRVLAGIVLDDEGRAASDAVVALEALDGELTASVASRLGLETEAAKSGVRSTVTDADGGFAFDGLDAGRYLLTTSLRDHLGDTRPLEIIAAAGTTFVDILLTPTGTFTGVATLENATLHDGTVVYVPGTSYMAVTDLAGAYAMTGVPIGSWPVRGFHAGYLDDETTGALAAAGDTTVLTDLFLPLDANMAPVIDSISATAGVAGTPSSFGAAATDLDGSIVLWEWDFDDDGSFDYVSPATGATTHVYATAGTYLAKLRVTDDDGAFALGVVSVLVDPPVAYDGIFVSPSGDDQNDGSSGSPLLTIGVGLTTAQNVGKTDVYVQTGTYLEQVAVVAGINIHGGRNGVNWDRDPGQYSTITGFPVVMTSSFIATATDIDGINVLASDATAAGEPSVALVSEGDTGALTFTDCIFRGGRGGNGGNGTPGVDGVPGNSGNSGGFGLCDDESFVPGGSGGGSPVSAGGNGGHGGQGPSNGQSGASGAGGANGGFGGSSDSPGNPGFDGQNGANGVHGNGGTAASSLGFIAGGQWSPLTSTSGIAGSDGQGGGGGGGGGGQDGVFVIDGTGNGGGGGGGGAAGASAGGGGQGGGASFGVLLITSSPSFDQCTFVGGLGGDGGFGGDGGQMAFGGAGGAGGSFCTSDVGAGGDGGTGGFGGAGGGGGGGPGGPSFCIFGFASTPTVTGATYQVGTGGTGGAAGTGGSGGGGNGVAGGSGASGASNI